LGLSLLIAQTALAFDHEYQNLSTILKAHLSYQEKQTLVNYKELKKAPERLNAQVAELSGVTKTEFNDFSKDQQIAFLINAYNAFTLELIVDYYPVKSIKKIGSFFQSPWKKEFFTLLGEKTSLDMIENDMLRSNYPEPRVHFALNCASIGCPSLRPQPFVAERLNQQFEEATRDFLNNQEKNHYDQANKTLFLSKIFDWYESDFEKSHGSVAAFAASYLDATKDILTAIKTEKTDISYLSYDWSLNEKK